MRQVKIRVPVKAFKQLMKGMKVTRVTGRAIEYPVKVDWPELRLTEEQILSNALALLNGHSLPYPDHSIFSVVVEPQS